MIIPNFENYQNSVSKKTDNYLYYYTKGDTLFKILENLSIQVSRYNHVNDLDEANLDCLGRDWPKQFKLRPFIYENCCFISFVRNIIADGRPVLGTEHPRMWTQYGEDNHGACIIINKENLLKRIGKISEISFGDIGDIDYKWDKCVSPEKTKEIIEFCNHATEEEILINYSKEMLLTKHKDWEQENEARLYMIKKSIKDIKEDKNKEEMKVSISGCVEGICLGYKFLDKTERVIYLAKLLSDTYYKYCDQIKLDAFGLVVSPEKGYVSWPVKTTFHLPNKISPIMYAFTKLLDENYPFK